MNIIHPTAIIGSNVELGDGNIIGPYCVIGGPYWLGNKDLCNGKVYIGNNNTIVNAVIILSPFRTKETRIGNYNDIYSQCFIGHDAQLGNHIIMTAACRLAGVVTIEDYVNLGIGAKIHQRKVIGEGAMLGMGCVVTMDILPYDKVVGVPARSIGLNEVCMDRRKIDLDYVWEKQEMFIEKYGTRR